jgi:hypothetical protein
MTVGKAWLSIVNEYIATLRSDYAGGARDSEEEGRAFGRMQAISIEEEILVQKRLRSMLVKGLETKKSCP